MVVPVFVGASVDQYALGQTGQLLLLVLLLLLRTKSRRLMKTMLLLVVLLSEDLPDEGRIQPTSAGGSGHKKGVGVVSGSEGCGRVQVR